MATAYVVTKGCYSDYYIVAVFSTKELAEEYVNGQNNGDCPWFGRDKDGSSEYRVEEYELDKVDEYRRAPRWFSEVNYETGEITPLGEKLAFVDEDQWGYHEKRLDAGRVYGSGKNRTDIAASYKSQEHANKLAAEARQKWLREFSTRPL